MTDASHTPDAPAAPPAAAHNTPTADAPEAAEPAAAEAPDAPAAAESPEAPAAPEPEAPAPEPEAAEPEPEAAAPEPEAPAPEPEAAEPEPEPTPSAPEPEVTGFAALGLRSELLESLTALGYEEPTPIQREAIPPVIAGRDLLGQAATGTGKTAAFALPILHRMPPLGAGTHPAALVLVPTRELAIQVSEAIHKYGLKIGARVLPIYGGQPMQRQLKALARGVDVVVATPGRALDHINRNTLKLAGLQMVVLDEADEMLDMGFADDIESILSATPPGRQTVLFSATMPGRIDKMARKHLRDPVRIQIERERPAAGEGPQVRQSAFIVSRFHKPAALGRILDIESPAAAIVFCRTRDQVDQLTDTLNGRGHRAEALHGGMTQEQRDKVMGRLRAGTAELLVATDVAARGLDIDQLTHVVNYDVPAAAEAYVHRIGRVGRAGREGVAITLAEPREHRMLKTIERVTGQRIGIEKIPTVADLHARRLEATRGALHELLTADDLEHARVVVESLTDEFDLMQVALAAVKLAHERAGGFEADDEDEIPQVSIKPERAGGPGGGRPDRGPGGAGGAKPWEKRGPGGPGGPKGGGKGRPTDGRPMTRIFIGAGRSGNIRPADLVGAITGESHITGRDIGAIQISEKFSLVEVPEGDAEQVIAALRAGTIKGKKTTVRREKF
ncbi:DEAD/DEAH box helicase [Paraconexibacter antarcticus]|uniref:DEAD/DEAH box helicase n=1 Tax=Paraconexibacter antarcticus TaxID=2949664 RepID=A0ABY5DTC6_9ACTN|nr:DEAD/DEAH box helicase [Paraconexibacter antarcticus]UTI64931.1 DEAD/DEAH box helicase [Paraconexibacter antarcticus]